MHTIMVIEDEALLLEAITKKLQAMEIDVISCAGGREALKILQENEKKPDVIWLDYYLKDMSGIEVMEKLQAHPEWAHIPVVVVSNSASDDKVQHMLKLGVKKYLLKAEHRLDEIIAIVESVAENGE